MIDYTTLPVYRSRQQILDVLETNQVIIVESPTGSGKTTQIPLILNEAGYADTGIIGITQPRRIAAVSVCEFIKKQTGDKGSFCGYTMRFHDTTDSTTRIKIMTDGILLQEVKADPLLEKYSVIMVDEAHERSLNIDFILGLLKEILPQRPGLKVIVSSATINAESFSTFFDCAPIVSIDGNMFPVKVEYVPVSLTSDDSRFYKKICEIVYDTHLDPDGGDVLIFLPGEAEIKACMEKLRHSWKINLPEYQIYPLYGRLSKEEQDRVFTPTANGKTKVVVATNVAETSLTIDGIKVVIDSGYCKINYYNQKNFTSSLTMTPISKASANQRKGRAGRTQSGTCYRLYDEKKNEKRKEFTEEQILHSDLAEVVLRMSELGIYNPVSFPFITAPKEDALWSAIETLQYIGAVDEELHLTAIGEMMIKFPLVPRLSRVIVEAIIQYPQVIDPVLTAVSFLSTKGPFTVPEDREEEARAQHHMLVDNQDGDFAAYLTIYKKYVSIGSDEERQKFCESNFLDKQTMDEIVHIKGQLRDIVADMGIPVSEGNVKMKAYLICLASGLKQYICKRQSSGYNPYSYGRSNQAGYRSAKVGNIYIHPGCSWFRNKPEYMLAGELVETSKLYARTVSPLRPEWIQEIDPNLFRDTKARNNQKPKKKKSRRYDWQDDMPDYWN